MVTDRVKYVQDLDLTGTPRGAGVHMDAGADAGAELDEAKKQAQVVGSALVAFAPGVSAQTRVAISDSALLAQLVANKRASQDTNPIKWFDAYAEVLQNVGWVLQAGGWSNAS